MATILLVDDDHDILDLMTRKLQNHGFTVVTASNGAEAVTAVAESAPSLILMDINMPELDGIEATRQIRAAEPEKQIPVIAITAYSLPGDQDRAFAAGCNAFHSKPVDFDELFDQISDLTNELPRVRCDAN